MIRNDRDAARDITVYGVIIAALKALLGGAALVAVFGSLSMRAGAVPLVLLGVLTFSGIGLLLATPLLVLFLRRGWGGFVPILLLGAVLGAGIANGFSLSNPRLLTGRAFAPWNIQALFAAFGIGYAAITWLLVAWRHPDTFRSGRPR